MNGWLALLLSLNLAGVGLVWLMLVRTQVLLNAARARQARIEVEMDAFNDRLDKALMETTH